MMMHIIAAVILSVGLLFSGAGIASAQHHGGYGGHQGGYVPVHHGVNYGHNDWHHVIPHHPTYVGAYYTSGQTHYYTPSPITSLAPVGGAHAASSRVVVEAYKPVELAFGGYSRYEDLAGRLTVDANAMCLDLHYNYRHNSNFAEVYDEAYSVLRAAKYVHGKEHQGDRETIRARMVEVDQLFHHVQEETRGWTRTANRQIGAGALPDKIAGVEAVLHHLCFDVGVKPHEVIAEEAPAPEVSNKQYPLPPASVGKEL